MIEHCVISIIKHYSKNKKVISKKRVRVKSYYNWDDPCNCSDGLSLIDIDVEGMYFQDLPILGTIIKGKVDKPHITIFCQEKSTKHTEFSLEIIFPKKYKEVFACSTTKDLIRVCLLLK
jgi:hypothetical protein